jgi:4a-hydroxytetrahydrobiopterin dehydratase
MVRSEGEMEELKSGHCVPCRGGEPTATQEEMERYSQQVPEWRIVERDSVNQLEREYKFKNFRQSLDFTNKVGELAEAEDHHPLIKTEWGKVTVTWWTHKIKGLHKNDFIMAAKTDEAFESTT